MLSQSNPLFFLNRQIAYLNTQCPSNSKISALTKICDVFNKITPPVTLDSLPQDKKGAFVKIFEGLDFPRTAMALNWGTNPNGLNGVLYAAKLIICGGSLFSKSKNELLTSLPSELREILTETANGIVQSNAMLSLAQTLIQSVSKNLDKESTIAVCSDYNKWYNEVGSKVTTPAPATDTTPTNNPSGIATGVSEAQVSILSEMIVDDIEEDNTSNPDSETTPADADTLHMQPAADADISAADYSSADSADAGHGDQISDSEEIAADADIFSMQEYTTTQSADTYYESADIADTSHGDPMDAGTVYESADIADADGETTPADPENIIAADVTPSDPEFAQVIDRTQSSIRKFIQPEKNYFFDEDSLSHPQRKVTSGVFEDNGWLERIFIKGGDYSKVGVKIGNITVRKLPTGDKNQCATQEIQFKLHLPAPFPHFHSTKPLRLNLEYDDFLHLYLEDQNTNEDRIALIEDSFKHKDAFTVQKASFSLSCSDQTDKNGNAININCSNGELDFVAQLETCGTGLFYAEFNVD